MLTDLDIYVIALNALQKEFDALTNDEFSGFSNELRLYELSRDIVCVCAKINEYVRRSKSDSGLDDNPSVSAAGEAAREQEPF